MDRRAFLLEEYRSVETALREALRHDYGPERSKQFYDECKLRLAAVKHEIDEAPELDGTKIADQLRALASVGSRVALLERSRLGEFSWPFAHVIREFAECLFKNEEASGVSTPIVHVIAEGIGYQIFDDDLERMFSDRIMIVAFPRQLRHHVLLHSIFGHELGHPATKSDATMEVIFHRVLPVLGRGPLRDGAHFRAWLGRDEVPEAVRRSLPGEPRFSDDKLLLWRYEVLCDLFGLLLFGPAFACAHRTLLEPLCAPPTEYDLGSSTHPPYPFRKRILADAMRLLGWLNPIRSGVEDGDPQLIAEQRMLAYAGGDPPPEWTRLVVDEDLDEIIAALKTIFDPHPGTSFDMPEPETLSELLDRLVHCRPPIIQRLDDQDRPLTAAVPIQHCLYAGWTFWFGIKELRAHLLLKRPDLPPLEFLDVNRLCEQALLQQRAIDAYPKAAI